MIFNEILNRYRKISFSERDKGDRFERLMQAYLRNNPLYKLKEVWLWNEFPSRADFGGSDTGIDLVALTLDGDYWAVQCKCFQESAVIDKPAVDSFLSTSSREFKNSEMMTVGFAHRLWISTTNRWGSNATEAIQNQNPPVTRINLFDLQEAPVDWEKLDQGIFGEAARLPKKSLRPHQQEATDKTHQHFKTSDRGKLIMACGTGKTFCSLGIAENETGGSGIVLFLVPSISLLGQTLREWSADASVPVNPICICSDPEISRKKTKNEDSDTSSIVDLALPASTNVKQIIRQFERIKFGDNAGMTVVFSTYQSIDVISKAQKELEKKYNGFGRFDLIICDEAHRTTGVSLAGEDESAFTKVHDNDFIKAKKRLYMTATPRLYSDDSKSKAAQADAVLCSMDDTALYGEEIYRIGFGQSVEQGLLSDYKVLILTLNENDVPQAIQKMISDKDSEINSDDASKLIGCINALSKQILGDEGVIRSVDPDFMKRAVAFCPKIVASKKITATFNIATSAYISSLIPEKQEQMVKVASRHIDGTMSAPERDELLGWLKGDSESNECRVLTNVRCLSEGVDVPSLDAVMFLSARNSQVDVVQSVGRVMRKSPGKKYGYIIIPVIVPATVEADKALDDNERYKVVWTVLNALRAHDDRFNATVNKIELNRKRPDQIVVGRLDQRFIGDDDKRPGTAETEAAFATNLAINQQLSMQFQELQHVIFARMVNKVGDRKYWEQWAKNVAEIAERHIERINRLITQDTTHAEAFAGFLEGLQKNINPGITGREAVEMLSQHIITRPVFEALFEDYSFVKSNPISVSMQSMLDLLEAEALEKDTEILQKFYESVKMKASGIDNAEGKQRIIIELYDKFFKTAFPKMVEKLGIVYTPVEVVDFIIHSVNDVLRKEFGRTLSDENIHILDPFTGTGTFITRLLQSGLIDKKDLARKYQHEIHANEIVLLAYYIAAINIENAYHSIMIEEAERLTPLTPLDRGGLKALPCQGERGGVAYQTFNGICLTDTFQLGENDVNRQLFSEMFPQNSDRVIAQKKAPLRVIIGNPPYSVGQKSANDNAQNQKYEKLDARIASSYAAATNATNKNSLYDSYIKAFRWSTDRLDPQFGGIIAFVSNGAWLDGNSADGFRKCLEKEFSSIYVVNLRGNARTQGELRQKEAGNVFGSGSRTPIAITLLVKNPESKTGKTTIHYHDIGDYLNREEKLSAVKRFSSICNTEMPLQILASNEHGDWISQRDDVFGTFIAIGDKEDKNTKSMIFNSVYSRGLASARDAWCYNSSKNNMVKNINDLIEFYNQQRIAFFDKQNKTTNAEDFITYDSKRITWNRGLKNDLQRNKEIIFVEASVLLGLYRPFCKQNVYFSRELNDMVYQIPKLFPTPKHENLVICVSGVGVTKDFSCIISDTLPDLELIGKSQCFPLYYYEERQKQNPTLFDAAGTSEYIRRDGVSDFILERAHKIYGKNVSREDIFYYVYGFLHSPEYRTRFSNDLKKMLPRLPLLEDVRDFWKFSKAGRTLADLHIHYETVPPYQDVKVSGAESGFYTVEQMRFPKKGEKETIIYNSRITIQNIPAKAYQYVVNGKSAIEWIMERYQITTHKESGIKNNPNDWAEDVGNPGYILDLLLSVINVSVQTVDIVDGLPKVDFAEL